jgi:hypothetical protein
LDKKLLTISLKKLSSFLNRLRLTEIEGGGYIFLGAAGIFISILIIYTSWLWNESKTSIHFTPADVIYGEKIRAVHDIGTVRFSRYDGNYPADPKVNPEIRLSENFYDFGEANPQQILTRTFVIANTGQTPLVIRHAYTTCGCTIADFTATEIPPGKVALMTLQFDTSFHDMRGTTVRRGVIVETNDPTLPVQEIWIQASIR